MRRIARALCAASVIASGCAPADTAGRVAALEAEVAKLRAALNEQRAADDKERAAVTQFMDAGEVVTLKPTDAGYVALWHDLGVFAIEFADVTPDALGSVVRLRIGNVTAAAVNNVEATIAWGANPEDPAATKSKRVTLGRTLPQSAWTDVVIMLEGITPRDLAFVRLSDLEVGSVSLRRPNRP